MPKAVELLRQGRNEELWQKCCGFLHLDLGQFMLIQRRLLLEQIKLLSACPLGDKIMRGARPRTVAEFMEQVPLTTYADYQPELTERQEDTLPARPAFWVHTSGRSGEYPCKWVPVSPTYADELSVLMYGIGTLSCSKGWGDVSRLKEHPKLVYTVAPRPYMSGAMASILPYQTPVDYLPPMEESEDLTFEERVKLGFRQALTEGIDYFFGLSLVLAAVGDKFSHPTEKISIRPLLSQPRALLRLAKGLIKSKLAGRPLLPKDLWSVRGIMCGGLDSGVYREKIRELWGRYPLDVYASTEGSVVATQTWDYDSMTFIPNLNFLEFIPEKEHLKGQLDPDYQLRTLLLDEVKAGECYEIVITNLHGGALCRYRIGDIVRIISLRNERLGISLPQMVFERRADGLLDFVVVRLSEKVLWQAIENTGVAYEDWTALKEEGRQALHLLIELKDGCRWSKEKVAAAVYHQIMESEDDTYSTSPVHDDLSQMVNFRVKVTLLPHGAFASYTRQRQAEGADLAHLKPPHINPSGRILALLQSRPAAVAEAKRRAEVAVH
ncbi:GH3 auxin-responsive promoter family protein [Chloroflexota bacterium]